ncbi:hypothetical protein CI610_01555 [invertebrate metagenome]|uniref:Uncharacterized protein n=1 Tax=invertebrate metagenome TaxID=1711999 RepID=A0A2H9T8H5_9ZZZZ
MKNKQVQQLLHDIKSLSPQQFGILQQVISCFLQNRIAAMILKIRLNAGFPAIPIVLIARCWMSSATAFGQAKQCHRIFNAFTKTPLSRLRHNHSGRWSRYQKEMTRSTTLRKAAKICEITLKTAFLWRHKIWQIVNNDQTKKA